MAGISQARVNLSLCLGAVLPDTTLPGPVRLQARAVVEMARDPRYSSATVLFNAGILQERAETTMRVHSTYSQAVQRLQDVIEITYTYLDEEAI